MKVSILICTRDRAASLCETLRSIQQCDVRPGTNAEIVVIDNGSHDETASVARNCEGSLPVRYYFESGHGKSVCLNRVIHSAVSEILLFTDDDVRVPKNWITGMTAPISAGSADAVAGAIRIGGHLLPEWMTPLHRSLLASTESAAGENPCFVGANAAISLAALRTVGGYDEEIGPGARAGHAEDTLLYLQLRERGCRVEAAYDVVVEHHFEPERLSRNSFERLMIKRGEFNAYVAHHWFHAHWRLPRLKFMRELCRLQWNRLLHWREWKNHPSTPAWELHLMEGLYTFREYIRERRRPRNYDQHGIFKIKRGTVRNDVPL